MLMLCLRPILLVKQQKRPQIRDCLKLVLKDYKSSKMEAQCHQQYNLVIKKYRSILPRNRPFSS